MNRSQERAPAADAAPESNLPADAAPGSNRLADAAPGSGRPADSGAPDASYRLYFPQLEREIPCAAGESLFHAARRHGVRIVGACGGRGTCASCMVRVSAGALRPLEGRGARAFEIELDEAGHPLNPRRWMRACRIGARSDCTVEIGARSLAPVVRAEEESALADEDAGFTLALDPAVRAHELDVPAPSLADDRADADRVLDACREREAHEAGQRTIPAAQDAATPAAPPRALTVAPAATAELAAVLRAGSGPRCRLRAWQRGGALIAFAPSGRRSLGLAVDLGTTNLAAFLVDLDDGRTLARLGVENPQTAWGADLVSRIDHASGDPKVAEALRAAACEAIDALAHDLCASIGQRPQDIVDVAVCGNTAMHHLLLGLPVRQLGRAPFVAALRDSVDLSARELGLAVAPGAWVHVAPNIGGFIGGDHVSALLATESRWRGHGCALVMDIGTNTEISLIHHGRLWSASSPSGPALEGGHIGCGMRAAEGAIEKVTVDGGRLAVRTIGGGEAVGLCGSGVLDAVAALRRGGLLDARGRLCATHPDIVTDEGGQRAARLAPEVLFTQADVRAVQLAKAAIRSATELLLAEAGLAEDAIECFILAGAFGAYLDIDSGIDIGLFPPLPRSRFVQVGNAAGQGVRRLLLSCAEREHARELARTAQACALNARADFQNVFLRHIGFAEPSEAAATTACANPSTATEESPS